METGCADGLCCAYGVTLFAETVDFRGSIAWLLVRNRRHIECVYTVIVIREEGPHNRDTALVCKTAVETRTVEV